MKHWQETGRILGQLAQLVENGRGAALATVIRVEGSAYRRPGAKFLIADDGTTSGGVSGGCLEADVREIARSVIERGAPQLLHYDTVADDQAPFDLDLGCNGNVDIFVQRATDPDAVEAASQVLALLKGNDSFSVSTVVNGEAGFGQTLVVRSDRKPSGSTGNASLDGAILSRATELLAAGVSKLDDVDGYQVFTDVQIPPPSLLIFGAGDDTRPLAALAAEVGFRVTVADHRSAHLVSRHYPPGTRLIEARPDSSAVGLLLGMRTYAVVKTHSMATDREWVARLLASSAPYIGVLGPRERTGELLRELGAEDDERVFGPVGLDLGADGAEQIAISIIAELLAVLSGREPGHLRTKESAIHAG